MRLFPPELEIGLDEGFSPDKDIFKRGEFGARLTAIVRVLDGPAVLVLDAPWGTGKTSFVRMWRGSLNREGVPTIYFDAFANDYHEDAFLALAAEIIARADEVKPRSSRAVRSFKTKAVKVAKVLGRASLHLGVRLGTAGVLAGSDVEEVVAVGKDAAKEIGKEVADALDQLVKERLESHRSDRLAFAQFSEALRNLATNLGTVSREKEQPDARKLPLVFIIDELDRCRPTFALSLLEKIKHFFAVPGIIFLLVTNLEQLQAAVRLAYGADVDARSYLEKFYHMRLSLPPDQIRRNTDVTSIYFGYLFSNVLPQGDDVQFLSNLHDLFVQFTRREPTSLRTLERIATYTAMVLVSTTKDHLRLAPIVAGLCWFKVKAPSLYATARDGKLTFSHVDTQFHFSDWRDDGDPRKRARIAEYAENWWRYVLGEMGDENKRREYENSISRYGIDHPPSLITFFCSVIDGFSFPREA